VLATAFNDPGASGLIIEHNHTVRILLPELSFIGQIALERTGQSRKAKETLDISTTYCFQDDNYERPDIADHRSHR
jgi:hypothetical protein